jgi:hypothetical protein
VTYRYYRTKPRRSWHVIAGVDAVGVHSRCGRSATHPVEAVDVLPGDQRTCERCMVLAVRDGDA